MSLDEVRQYYPNINIIESSGNVQYVINQDESGTQYESQQIVLSEDQHILLNTENQQIIIDQSQLQYAQTNQQFIVQENDVVTDYQQAEIVNSAPQQIYYTQPKPHVIQQPSTQVPILQRQIITRQPALIHHAPAMNNAELIVQRGVQQQITQQRPLQQQQNVGVRVQYALQQPQDQTQQQIDESQLVVVDGRYLTLAQYKQQLAQIQRDNERNNIEKPQQQQPYKAPPKRVFKRNSNGRGGIASAGVRGRGRGVLPNPQTPPGQAQPGGAYQQPMQKTVQSYPGAVKTSPQQQGGQTLTQSQVAISRVLPKPSQLQLPIQPPQQPVRPPQQPVQPPQQPPYQQRVQPLIPLSPHIHNGQSPYSSQNSQSTSNLDDSCSSVSDDYRDSARMLVCLENGEQRLITFTLPKESCTVQDLLEQVGVPFNSDTKIECMSNPGGEIDYIVNVGAVNHSTLPVEAQQMLSIDIQDCIVSQNGAVLPITEVKAPVQAPALAPVSVPSELPAEPEKPPEPPKILPKFIPGCLAVCNHCGYLSEDFNRCQRCKTRLPEDVKSISSKADVKKEEKSPKPPITPTTPTKVVTTPITQNAKIPAKTPRGGKKKTAQEIEPAVVTLSSDDEESPPKPTPNQNSITSAALEKEPVITLEHNKIVDTDGICGGGKEEDYKNIVSTTLPCRTIRIGSYRFVPREEVGISSVGLRMSIPVIGDPQQYYRLSIPTKYIIKVLGNFNKALPVLFFYVTPSIGAIVRKNIKMEEGSDFYFDPLSKEDPYKRITLLPDMITEETRDTIKTIYLSTSYRMLEELTAKEANEILVRTCPREGEAIKPIQPQISFTELRQLLIYPQGKGGIAINAEDYLCLAQDQFLNDVIIDFYLKYLHIDVIASPMQEKVYIFSSFFYKRLTTKPAKASKRSNPYEVDPNLTPAEKRHCRVKSWTKNVNIFEKDFIIIPINENSHWFLAIICFPGLEGCRSMLDSNKIVKVPTKEKKKVNAITIGNTTITTLSKDDKKPEKPIIKCDDEEGSDRDEAEGDESELEESENEEEVIPEKNNKVREPVKQPCILIFDSLAGASRSRVVATLRDYLTCEHRAKLNSNKIFNKDNIKGACPKVPQQQNFTDCGLYVLQYVESFFKDPITDYHIPIKMLKNWFEEIVVTRKREDISNLIKDLMIDNKKDPSILPNIQFPTLNGELVTMESTFDEAEGEMEEEEEEEEEPSSPEKQNNLQQLSMQYNTDSGDESPKTELNVTSTSTFVVSSASSADIKPALCETTKSNRDTMSYLKSKRIIRQRHKEADNKKQKFE